MFVDLHCHIIPGIDDGAKDIDTALQMSKIAVKNGIKHIVATPHYIYQDLDNNSRIVKQNLELLKGILQENKVELSLYPGCEAFICPELPELVKEGEICTLNDTSYILIELPLMSIPEYTEEVIYELKLMGYIPIIAHPERNQVLAEHPELLKRFIELGALTQVNTTSIRGLYGKKVKKSALNLLQSRMVHLVSSDAHTTRGRVPNYGKAKEIMEKLIGEKESLKIFNNAKAVLEGREIDVAEPMLSKRRRLFARIREVRKKVAALLG